MIIELMTFIVSFLNQNLKLIDTSLGMNYNHSIEELWLNPYNYLMMAKNTKQSLNNYISNPYLNKKIRPSGLILILLGLILLFLVFVLQNFLR